MHVTRKAAGRSVRFLPIADISVSSHLPAMFEVIATRRKFLTKRVTFRVLAPASGTETLVTGAIHGSLAVQAPYQFAKGFTFELAFPFWTSLKGGDKLGLTDILKHPQVQRELLSKAHELARR